MTAHSVFKFSSYVCAQSYTCQLCASQLAILATGCRTRKLISEIPGLPGLPEASIIS